MPLVHAEFQLRGKVPSKKNKKLLTRGRIITLPERQVALQALTLQARAFWGARGPLTTVNVDLDFRISDVRQDLDNMVSSAMDVLKDARVIVDDSSNHVKCIVATCAKVERGGEGVNVSITGKEERDE